MMVTTWKKTGQDRTLESPQQNTDLVAYDDATPKSIPIQKDRAAGGQLLNR
jgi:hypothetical protein